MTFEKIASFLSKLQHRHRAHLYKIEKFSVQTWCYEVQLKVLRREYYSRMRHLSTLRLFSYQVLIASNCEKKLFRNWFSPQHRQRNCPSLYRCKYFKRNHQTMLHKDFNSMNSPDSIGGRRSATVKVPTTEYWSAINVNRVIFISRSFMSPLFTFWSMGLLNHFIKSEFKFSMTVSFYLGKEVDL
jgi:hypothetical protein